MSAEISEAERRRQARRQRILGNTESRMQKILGPNARIPPTKAGDLYDDELEIRASVADQLLLTSSSQETKSKVIDGSLTASSEIESKKVGATTKASSDVTTRTTKVTKRQHHTILFLLSVTLSVLRGSYFFLYFLIYELTLFVISGYGPPAFYNVQNSFLTAMAMFGMPEQRRKVFHDFLLTVNWLTTDVTIFICSALFTLFLTYLLKGQ